MAKNNRSDEPDRFAAGTEPDDADEPAGRDMKPGVTGSGRNYLPTEGGGNRSDAAARDGTIGAAGEMDATGAPAGTSGAGSSISGGTSAGETRGGASAASGSASTGGTGVGVKGHDPQSAGSATAVLGDTGRTGLTGDTGGVTDSKNKAG